MAFVAVYSLLSILLFTIGCIPVRAMWDVTLMDQAKCIDQLSFVYANAAFNIFSDLATLILPIKICWTLQASMRQRTLLLILFVMGSLYVFIPGHVSVPLNNLLTFTVHVLLPSSAS